MNDLYYKLKNAGNFADAYLVLKNTLSKNLCDKKTFKEFINLSLEIAMYDIVFDERRQYVNEALSALSLFSETAELDEDTLTLIKDSQKQINAVYNSIYAAEDAFYKRQEKELRDNNTKLLTSLADKNKQLQNAKSQKDFDALLSDVTQIEEQLNKNIFSETQTKTYETLTRSYSSTISSKMEDLNRQSLLELNKRAISNFKNVFETFTNNKGRYKDTESSLKALMITKFFVFDTSKLFNESLIYYNHVYSMIFQEVNDELKYKLTEWALKTEKVDK